MTAGQLPPRDTAPGVYDAMLAFNDRLTDVAEEWGVHVPSCMPQDPRRYAYDGVHPDGRGKREIARRLVGYNKSRQASNFRQNLLTRRA